jgi:hypothetical protein
MIRLLWIAIVLYVVSQGLAQTGGDPRSDVSLTGERETDLRERERVVGSAELFLKELPVTITSFRSPRSAGGIHDFFSEGDYWWPDPNNPDAPYIQRDGQTNPENFNAHREALYRVSIQVAALTAAYRLTGDERFGRHAVLHLMAWFVVDSTRMSPHLRFAQAIRNKVTGRGIGIIDTIHLIELARSVEMLEGTDVLPPADAEAVKRWFRDYLTWLTTHQYGLDERDAKNNHGTWWVAQVAAFAHLVNDTVLLDSCRGRFCTVIMPGQMAGDGSFPLELKRTRPYSYSLFNLEGYAVICRILSTRSVNLWKFRLADGRSVEEAFRFMEPYIVKKASWPHPPDIMHAEHLPVRQSGLLFAGWAYCNAEYVKLWASLPVDLSQTELVRTFPIRQPFLWVPAGE